MNIKLAEKDKIFGLMELYSTDNRINKVNLISGVYRDDIGNVPVLSSVKKAEELILQSEKSKDYLSIEGGIEYRRNVLQLLLGRENFEEADSIQTPGGTAALRLLGEFIQNNSPTSTIWISNPTWPNHTNIFTACQLKVAEYRYFDFDNKCIAFSEMLEDLSKMASDDFLLIHGCCHNPTGADFTREQWLVLSELLKRKNCSLIIDCAYIGFAESLKVDVEIVPFFLNKGHDVFVATSFSKNFGLYNERIGALSILTDKHSTIPLIMSHMKKIARAIYSNPPAHGSNIVNTILSSHLKKLWEQDILSMNFRLKEMRQKFSHCLRDFLARDFDYIKQQKGLFSFININSNQAAKLRERHAIYMLDSGRINVAGLNEDNINRVCSAITDVCNN